MTGRWPPGSRHNTMLKLVAAAPFPFEVSIAPSETGASGSKWELTGLDPATGSSVTHTYLLTGQEQGDYLDLFSKVALSFRTLANELPGNDRFNGLNIVSVLVGFHGGSPSLAG